MKMFKLKKLKSALAVCAVAASLFTLGGSASAAGFTEYPIGDEIENEANHFKVALVYFQPIEMVPAGMMLSPDKADMHIETDIHATEGNDTGFGVGEWIPYLTVHYKFTNRQNYGLHVDEETGVKGRFWDEPVTMDWVFNYVPRRW